MQFKEKRKKNVQLDITPIVDMVFNLLIFFALSINFTAAASINLVLPKTSFPDPAPLVPVIQINKNHEIAVDRIVIAYEALPQAVETLYRYSGDPAIIIMADETVRHGFVVSVMDICRQAGFEKISISARLE
jgi:biopolymer transport protein ExbD